MVGRYSAYRQGSDTVPPDVVDRILIGACAAVWLLLVGVSVAAIVALADLGRGFHKVARTPHTPWILYVVIVVSALIIAGAIPMLLRARRMAQDEPAGGPAGALAGRPARSSAGSGGYPAARGAAGPRPERAQEYGHVDEWSGAAVDRIWLRGAVALTGTMGAALIAVGVATYLMAVGHDGASWVGYTFAGLITAAMPALEWLHVRQLREVIAVH
ncbi:hypothetical protein A5791_19755 [Mycobacterium sp. 852002-51163_SCH5372311]|uniref:DUF2561 family protein n=1 Tax=Mycobacterium sp. 852002-51163_SCH5372311 TaxID=1834097 RepID=UPI000800BB99|nr:DUF2561 family protein [Mycobacterium sp. 852002-51163_SCH5372311]OBF87186.1 hypothetical protein A5791_19755 [Mycobacterium sp. 852002-51163_SCH5372311]